MTDDVCEIESVQDGFSCLEVRVAMQKDVLLMDTEFTVKLAAQGDQVVTFRIDTAAATFILKRKAYSALKVKPKVRKGNTLIRGLFGLSRILDGCVELLIVYKQQQHVILCQIMNEDVPNLFSVHDCTALGLV